MLIEFFGLPGSGKSTMSRLVAKLLLRRGLIVDEITFDLDHRRRRFDKLLAKLARLVRYAFAHPCHALADLIRITATRQATLVDLGKVAFNWFFIASLASRKRSPSRITVLDQGVAQAMWSIGFAARNEKSFDRLLADMPGAALRPDLIIHVRTDFATIGDRLAARQRQQSRLDAFGRDHQALARAEANCDAIIGKLTSSGTPVIEVENRDPGQLVADARLIAGAILTVVNEQRSAAGGWLRHDIPRPETREALRTDRTLSGSTLPLSRHIAISGARGDVMTTKLGKRHDRSRP